MRFSEPTVLEAAKGYVARGWQVVEIAHGEKGPKREGWNVTPPTLEELPRLFAVTHPRQPQPNVGLLTGRISGGLVDVDCDTREAALAAEALLPPTKRVSGRAGHPRSHYWYVCADAATRKGGLPTAKFEWNGPLPGLRPPLPGLRPPLPHRERGHHPTVASAESGSPPRAGEGTGEGSTHESMLVELRGDRCQTVAPPSIHPSGERVRWEQDGEPSAVNYDELKAAVAQVAACALLARSWPAEGTRDETAMALSGMLMRADWSVAETDHFAQLVAWIAGDEEWRRRGKGASSQERLDEGESALGATALAKLLAGDGVAIVKQVRKWLALDNTGEPFHRFATAVTDTHIGEMSACEPVERAAGPWLHEVIKQPVRWLWDGRIALGAITLLDGDPGLGKSLVTLDLIARVTTGQPMPDDSPGVVGGAVLLSAEDDLATTVRPRLEAAGADLERIKAIETVCGLDAERGTAYERSIMLPRDVPLIATTIEEAGAKLVVIDPLMAYLDPKVNSWRDQDVRATLAPLARIARQLGAAVLILRHLTKGGGGTAIYRGGGSIGIIGAARSGLLIAKDTDNPQHHRILAATKSNLGPPVPSLRYELDTTEDGQVRVRWLGECEQTADSLLAGADVGAPTRRLTKREQAAALIRTGLASGPAPQTEIERLVTSAGISTGTMQRACEQLAVDKRFVGQGSGGHWQWSLPNMSPQQTDNEDSPSQSALTGDAETDRFTDTQLSCVSACDTVANLCAPATQDVEPATPDLLDTSDAPTLTVTASNGTQLTLTRRDLTPQPPLRSGPGSAERCSAPRPCRASRQGVPRGEGEPEPERVGRGCAHEYAQLRDAKGRRACIHCHTIEGTEGERLQPRGARKDMEGG